MKLAGLIVKNYKRIGEIECHIKIDDIVILIGQNNAGKSTILDAYEAFASLGAALDKSNFHDEDESRQIEITGIFNQVTKEDIEVLSAKWVHEDEEFGACIKVRWVWNRAGEKGKKQSFDPTIKSFVDGGVGGWDTLIKSRIPQPIRIRPTDSNETTQTKIVAILKEHIKNELKKDGAATQGALAEIERLGRQLFDAAKEDFDKLTDKVSAQVSNVFPGSKVEIVPKSKDSLDEKFIGSETYLRVSCNGGPNTPLSLQGTGLQRALLWSALSVMSDAPAKGKAKASSEAGKILLIDEPEAFLHPPTIRSAREALYDFALNNPEWQVIATTHSPIFIDLSKDHTTIVRVDAASPEKRYVSTDRVSFDEPEKKRLQMVRACNPVVNEFFFYDNIVLVEGETEQVVVNFVAQLIGVDVHVINCIGKANIPLFAKVLNHFKIPYVVIHDSDTPKCLRKQELVANGMWTMNGAIYSEVEKSGTACAFVQIPNFEQTFFGESLTSGKVDNALSALFGGKTPELTRLIEDYEKVLRWDAGVVCRVKGEFDLRVQTYLKDNELIDDQFWQLE
ncbi:TPA: AAA family ATPase [Pseudomonas aeruginosa]|uniref:ATP-dependent nuclease n=1 Tax=Pseudomonas aeruginosa TaxID=287 RepID=UPI00093DBAC2|nr:AAA family ATPase [Pseudomonas aeruginosa]MBH9101689.1 AAA family ATPase [Pseudomonas aeruginosa]MCS7871392.1 AAA family ATPase [Pseudomonas aeruginosa]MDU0742303.1 AAA family ATPase [Pseudomonas aeruginosa]MDU0754872.1 AAA family ATPase [Pseudomonas aeruginosa]HEJ6400160.1 AAA family ATPase [Pseudomonas aeruginosa]